MHDTITVFTASVTMPGNWEVINQLISKYNTWQQHGNKLNKAAVFLKKGTDDVSSIQEGTSLFKKVSVPFKNSLARTLVTWCVLLTQYQMCVTTGNYFCNSKLVKKVKGKKTSSCQYLQKC